MAINGISKPTVKFTDEEPTHLIQATLLCIWQLNKVESTVHGCSETAKKHCKFGVEL